MNRASLRALGAGVLTTVAAVVVLGVSGTAGAQPGDQPVSGDDRATAYPGNVKQDDCAAAGLAGTAVDVEATIVDNTYITITSVPSGITLTGVVVKGSPGYNVYPAGYLDELHAPLAGQSGKPAEISHWFACGTEGDTTTTSTTTTTSGTTTTTVTSGTTTTETTTSGSGTTTTGVSGTTESTTTSAAVTTTTTVAGGDDDLASTGASVIGYLVGALLLLSLGGGLLYLNRRRAIGH